MVYKLKKSINLHLHTWLCQWMRLLWLFSFTGPLFSALALYLLLLFSTLCRLCPARAYFQMNICIVLFCCSACINIHLQLSLAFFRSRQHTHTLRDCPLSLQSDACANGQQCSGGNNTRPQNKVNSLQRVDIWYNGSDDFSDNYATKRKILSA